MNYINLCYSSFRNDLKISELNIESQILRKTNKLEKRVVLTDLNFVSLIYNFLQEIPFTYHNSPLYQPDNYHKISFKHNDYCLILVIISSIIH